MKSQILHHEVRVNTRCMETGHWFFHTGQWCICAQAYKDSEGDWCTDFYLEQANKIFKNSKCKTLKEIKSLIAAYYELEVVRGKLPKIEIL
jgi:hypothetical protein